MIDVEIAFNELTTDAASTTMHLVDDLRVYDLDELIALSGTTGCLVDSAHPFAVLGNPVCMDAISTLLLATMIRGVVDFLDSFWIRCLPTISLFSARL